MSLVSVVPEAVTAASASLHDLGSALRASSTKALNQATAIAPPAADEISSAITALFGSHAEEFAAVSARASAFHTDFVKLLSGGAAQYLNAEIANAQQTLVNAINAPAQALLGHPLIGPGGIAPAATMMETNTIPTPFGPITITQTATFPEAGPPDFGTGPILAAITASTPLGPMSWSINGRVDTTMAAPFVSTLQLTGGAVSVPPQLRLLMAAAGPTVTGGFSLAHSFNAFTSAVGSGDILGAATAFFSAPFDYANASLFGHHIVELPLGALGGGPEITLRVPFGGVFAPSQPMTLYAPGYSVSPAPGVTQTFAGANFAFSGSRFGGIATEFLKLFGLPL
ncbi:PE family protein [Mycobacterium asiaticum]|uniref:PE domain-containing protein n=1 Tax=Mycobacterium asiaticum TaxID=1790 RepID=A0A1A3I8I4_MYCAS|nr:PE family protein [Mycobacterium asiaticum]OBJ56780.1 hypothetical protein A9W94_17720 [Mycobacterium asiaticum]OBJ87364.1 hypothetical protein A5640_07415 [Mycobacterium asiaticum]ORA11705.1 PE family protein [Mycobacterium asiaticum DSM 44297]